MAKRATCSVDTVKREARMGRLPYVQKFDGRTGAYLFDPKAVTDWIASRAVDAPDTEGAA